VDAQPTVSPKRTGEIHLTLPDFTSFTEQVGSTFEVVDILPAPFELKMTRVVQHSKTEHNQAFSVFFAGPAERFMTQGTRKLRNTQFGEIELF
jgi:hypothetical protein